MKTTTTIAVTVLALLAAGCGSAYHPLTYYATSGYAESQLSATTYSVTYQGDRALSREEVEQFAMYRAAELALAKGTTRLGVLERTTSNNDAPIRPFRRSSGEIVRNATYRTGGMGQAVTSAPPRGSVTTVSGQPFGGTGSQQNDIPIYEGRSTPEGMNAPSVMSTRQSYTTTLIIELGGTPRADDYDARELVTRLAPVVKKRIVL